MDMITNLHGRLRNTTLPMSHGLMPLFEAVVNSIHAIEEANIPASQGQILVEIIREDMEQPDMLDKKPGPDAVPGIIGFRIDDNGIGFDDENMQSFKTLDSEHKVDKGCRGVGRLLWLKAFSSVDIDSVFINKEDKHMSRRFYFSSLHGVSDPELTEASSGVSRKTSIHLNGFVKQYRNNSHKLATSIAKSLLEHCLWYFVRESSSPEITIKDGGEVISLDDIFENHMKVDSQPESINIKDNIFNLTHVKLRTNSAQGHVLAFCASSRLVKEEPITGKVPGLYGKINDPDGDFVYACYINSPYLDERVRSERTGFNIAEDAGNLFSETELELGLNEITSAVLDKVSNHLSPYLDDNRKAGRERVDSFVSKKAPKYRPILARIPSDKLSVDPSISDKDLDLLLHKHLSEIERALLDEGHDLMSPLQNENLLDYHKRVQVYLETAEDIKKSDLAAYVSHRRVVLDILEQAIQRGEDGKYAREGLIHNLIMPMTKESNEIITDGCNLWLIDERLAFHEYLASDKTLKSMPVTGSDETKEPDIFALNVYDNPMLVSNDGTVPLASIVVVEIKRPMRNDSAAGEKKDAVEQALGYLERIRQGKVKTVNGRPIPKSEDIPGYCYVVCDLLESVEKRCKMHGLTVTSDHMGYFGYNPNYKAYIEVISYDRLVQAAKERNKAFFDKLGLPTT
jgi:hypothetical protein